MTEYQIIAKEGQYIVEADGFEIDKDEGTITFYNCSDVTRFFKAVFILSNTIGVSIIEKGDENDDKSQTRSDFVGIRL